MARIRTIKPEFWRNCDLARLSEFTRLLAIALLNLADDDGYFFADPRLIRGEVFPFEDDYRRITVALQELSSVGYVALFSSSKKGEIGQVVNFARHQVINKPSPSRIRDFCREDLSELQRPEHYGRTPGSLPSGTGNMEHGTGNMEQGKEQGKDMSAHRGRSNSDFEEEFEQFWDAFPRQRRTKKQEAHRKWKLALKRVDAETLTTKAAEYAASEVGRGPYAVMPSVWLNGGCWEDSPEAWQLKPSGNSPPAGKPKQKGKRCLDAEFWKRAGGYNPNLTDEQLNELVEKYAD